jgi:hypothetical protein
MSRQFEKYILGNNRNKANHQAPDQYKRDKVPGSDVGEEQSGSPDPDDELPF